MPRFPLRLAPILAFAVLLSGIGTGLANDWQGLAKAYASLRSGDWTAADGAVVRRHAEAGDPGATEVLAWMYARGKAVEPDPLASLEWYLRAERIGVANALQNARNMYRRLGPQERDALSSEILERLFRKPRGSDSDPIPPALLRILRQEAGRAGVPLALALALAQTESSFDPTVESSAGARGILQIMPETALDEFGVHPDRLWDPRTNARLGLSFLRRLTDRYGAVAPALSHYYSGRVVNAAAGPAVHPIAREYVRTVSSWREHFAARGF